MGQQYLDVCLQTGSGAVTPPTRSWIAHEGADDLILCLELNPGQLEAIRGWLRTGLRGKVDV